MTSRTITVPICLQHECPKNEIFVGSNSVEGKYPTNPESMFYSGLIGASVLQLMLIDMEKSKLIDLDTPVHAYWTHRYPTFIVQWPNGQNVTVRSLMLNKNGFNADGIPQSVFDYPNQNEMRENNPVDYPITMYEYWRCIFDISFQSKCSFNTSFQSI